MLAVHESPPKIEAQNVCLNEVGAFSGWPIYQQQNKKTEEEKYIVVKKSLFLQYKCNMDGMEEKQTCLCSNEGCRREDIVLMIPPWPWEYVQLPRPLWKDECCLWLIISWYPAFKWLPHLGKTVTVVVLQMFCYMRNIILITKQQLVVCISQLPWAGSAKVFVFLSLQHKGSKW